MPNRRNVDPLQSLQEDYTKLNSRNQVLQNFLGRVIDPQILEHNLDQEFTADGRVCNVCVMFTDIRGFTSYSEKSSLPAVMSMLNNFYDIVIDHTHYFDGIVDKFVGDGTMSIFGAYDNDNQFALKAVKAAQAILHDFEQMTQQKHEPNLFLRVGITSGPAIVGMFGNGERVEFTAIGHTVNMAARLQSKSRDNKIAITKDVAEQLPSSAYVSRGKFELKNVSKKVEVFEVR